MMEATKIVTDEELKEYFPDLPGGPLDVFRKRASFNWRRMKLVYDNLSTIKIKVSINLFYFLINVLLILLNT